MGQLKMDTTSCRCMGYLHGDMAVSFPSGSDGLSGLPDHVDVWDVSTYISGEILLASSIHRLGSGAQQQAEEMVK